MTGETLQVGLDSASFIRSSVGVGLLWDSPLGPLRFDLAYPLTKYCATPTGSGGEICDRTQYFPFQRRHQVLILTAAGCTTVRTPAK